MKAATNKVPNNILQQGTATGHFHQAQGPDVAVIRRGNGLDLLAPKGARIVHQEHGAFPVAPREGGYSRRIVQMYDHFAEEARNVED